MAIEGTSEATAPENSIAFLASVSKSLKAVLTINVSSLTWILRKTVFHVLDCKHYSAASSLRL
jgi:exosome complex RNA-binding protein Rrp42 (RNase PH superfamily)